jgi:transcription elongation GreA/GreB family factor
MSRAFVKGNDEETSIELPDRPISEHPNDVTEHGLQLIEQAVAEARHDHAAAQASNDRAELAKAARELRYWSSRRATARVVKPADCSQVRFGCSVTIDRSDGRTQTFQIVGEDEADPRAGKISHVSPLARALFGKVVGDIVKAGNDDAEITRIFQA